MHPHTIPATAVRYKTVGPFDLDSLPDGLEREHRLKEGTWGSLTILAGQIAFVWDDEQGGEVVVETPATIVIPPEVPHHLRPSGPVLLEIGFHRTA